jgi:hypothetical protein
VLHGRDNETVEELVDEDSLVVDEDGLVDEDGSVEVEMAYWR